MENDHIVEALTGDSGWRDMLPQAESSDFPTQRIPSALECSIIDAQAKEIEKLRAQLPRWIPVTERLPENADAVLVRGYAVNSPKYKATFKGRWIAAHSMLADDFGADSDMDLEYDEAEDEYYVPEGWFERIENWDDYTDIAVCDFTITHWMPLPEPPEAKKALEALKDE